MNLHNITADALAALHLPDEFIAALRAGTEWEYQPDSIEGGDADVYYCDDCGDGTWHLVWSVFGLRLDTDGNLYETEWTVDTDGDWDFADEHEYGTYDHMKAHEDAQARFREYAAWVIENGRDPADEFTRSGLSAPEEFTVAIDPVSLEVAGWRELPERARAFLELDANGRVQGFDGWDDLKARAAFVTWVDANTLRFEVPGQWRTSGRDEIVAQAQEWLARQVTHVPCT